MVKRAQNIKVGANAAMALHNWCFSHSEGWYPGEKIGAFEFREFLMEWLEPNEAWKIRGYLVCGKEMSLYVGLHGKVTGVIYFDD